MGRVMTFLLVLLMLPILVMAGCREQVEPPAEPESQVLEATVLEVTGQTQLLVEPVEGSPELGSADRIVIHAGEASIRNAAGEEITLASVEMGSLVHITYDGNVAESDPAQIWASRVQTAE